MISTTRRLVQFGLLLACVLACAARFVAQSLGEPASAFAQSLALRADRIIADQTLPLMAWLAQTEPVSFTAQGPLLVQLTLETAGAEPRLVKSLGETLVLGGNLASMPFPISIDARGVADGDYQYAAEVRESGTLLRRLRVPVKFVAGLYEKQPGFEQRLAGIQGHDSAKATIRYPFDLARVINSGKRMLTSNSNNPEFGLNQAGQAVFYDFAAGLRQSADLLAALERGADPLYRARGEMTRHYYMPEAGEILPYRVFVPPAWDGRAPLPLVFILHGNSRDQDFYFDRDGRIIPKTAEKHDYMLVAPLGYYPNGGYNYTPNGRGGATGPRGVPGALAQPQTFGPPQARGGRGAAENPGFGGVNGSVTPALIRSEWSEQDTMRVLALIKEEYPIDPKRTFLFGYSAGGQGAHYLGPKHAEEWAAIAIGGSNATPGAAYPFDRVKNIPMLIFVGTEDTANISPSRAMAQALRQNGVAAELREIPGANHDTAPSMATPDIFAFFDAHPRK